ncbi:954d51a6-7905-409c-b6f2-8f48965cc804 [Sclerotinia trifoliorum]|uniref:954d51a6-7905-409c-b6f2-8f48965cc804 n=1 Tax=Sclerotinia trifoliorum TaxID=28548 RepID=A0A8H2W3Y8_9HELO|nr:954d51a6-7905-409c-b6f2-8f48965cc804 [Sclerotinia trifoliorum]
MATLTKHDLDVLEKIKDPESGPSIPLLIDDSLPKDPHITDPSTYQGIAQRERDIILSMQDVELQIAGFKPVAELSPLSQYQSCVQNLNDLIEEYPNYASARNNRAQALRRIYGDLMLVKISSAKGPGADVNVPLDTEASEATIKLASFNAISDLDRAISLLAPKTPWASISPQAAKTLSQALTQRGALYHLSAKQLNFDAESSVRIDERRRETRWKTIDFEEAASRDFMTGGRYGNEIAKALAVSANPTAKLCGDMVRQAMKREIGGGES